MSEVWVRRFLSFVAAMALVAGTSRAATYTWTSGAVPTWDTTGTNWGGSALDSYWDATHGPSNVARLNTAGAAPAPSGTVYAGGIVFDNTATVVGGGTIALAGAAPTITTNGNGAIHSAIEGSAGLTKSGGATLELGNNTSGFTGDITIAAGTLTAAARKDDLLHTDPFSTCLGLATPSRTITVSGGATLNLADNNIFGDYQSTMTPAMVVYGTLQQTGNTIFANVLGNLDLRGGTLDNAATSPISPAKPGAPSICLSGTVAVSGTSPSLIKSATAQRVGLSSWAGNSYTTTFNVGDVTGNSTADLLVTAVLGNDYWYKSPANHPGSLVKSGPGTLLLLADNTYTGGTTVSEGALLLGQSGHLRTTTGVSVTGTGVFGTAYASSNNTVNVGGLLNLAAATTLNLQDGKTNTLSVGLLTLSGAALKFDLGTTAGDLLAFGGTANASGANAFNFNTVGTSLRTGTRAYTLMSGSGLSTSPFSAPSSIVVSGTTYNLALQADSAGLYLDVTMAGNNAKLWVGATEPTTSMQTTSVAQVFGRVMQGSTQSAAVTLNTSGSSAASTTASVAAAGAASTTTPGSITIGSTASINAGLDTATTGPKTGTITIDNQAATSAGASQGSDNGNAVINVSGTVLDKRVVTADSVSLGLVHAGANLSGSTYSSTLRTSGDDDNRTRVTVNGTLFSAAGVTSAITPAGPASVAASGTMTTTYPAVTAENGGAGLSGEGSYAAVTVPYTASAFSGTATYTGASGGNWSAHANWTDGGGVHAAPGTFAGFDNDAALVDGDKTVVMDSPLTLGSLTLSGTAKVALGGATSVNLGNAVKLGDLNLNAHATSGLTAALNLNKSKLIVDKTQVSVAAIRAQIKSAYAAARWTGAGIGSAAAAADYAAYGGMAKTGVGYLDNALAAGAGGGKTSWQGRSVDSNSVLVRFTYYGDANLDGAVNLADFGLLKLNFGTGTQWSQGDFDYSGSVNLGDFGKLKQAFGSTPLTTAEAVPEPAAWMLLVSGAWSCLAAFRPRRSPWRS